MYRRELTNVRTGDYIRPHIDMMICKAKKGSGLVTREEKIGNNKKYNQYNDGFDCESRPSLVSGFSRGGLLCWYFNP